MATSFVSKDGLTYFWGKLKAKFALKSHTHVSTDISEPTYLLGDQPFGMRSKHSGLRANKLMFLPADQIIIEQTTDGGATWVSANVSDENKRKLFDQSRGYALPLPKIDGVKSLLCGVRITITAMKYNVPEGTPETEKYAYWNANYVKSAERYCYLFETFLWLQTNSDRMGLVVQASTGADPNTWRTIFSNQSALLSGWSGSDYVKTPSTFGGGTTQTTQNWNLRFTFMTRGVSNNGNTLATTYTTSGQAVYEISSYGTSLWTAPNAMVKNDHLYSWDYLQNATFPAKVTALQFETGTAETSYFQSRRFRGQGDASTYYHAVDFGYSGHDRVDFYEYGGVWYFWRNRSTTATSDVADLVAKLELDGISNKSYKYSYPNKTGTFALTSDIPTWANLSGKPTLATVATSGSYDDLSNKPTIPSAVTESTVSGWGFTKTLPYTHPATHPASMITGLATVATSGSYNDLKDKPSIGGDYEADIQDTLLSVYSELGIDVP